MPHSAVILSSNQSRKMDNIQDIASHLHRIQADARNVFGDEPHTAHYANGENWPCENCSGHYIEGVDRCAQYHLCKLITGSNPFKYIEDTKV